MQSRPNCIFLTARALSGDPIQVKRPSQLYMSQLSTNQPTTCEPDIAFDVVNRMPLLSRFGVNPANMPIGAFKHDIDSAVTCIVEYDDARIGKAKLKRRHSRCQGSNFLDALGNDHWLILPVRVLVIFRVFFRHGVGQIISSSRSVMRSLRACETSIPLEAIWICMGGLSVRSCLPVFR